MSLPGLAFRLALLAHPPDSRRSFRAEAVEAFEMGYRRRRRERGWIGGWTYATRATADALRAGIAARFGTRDAGSDRAARAEKPVSPGGRGRRPATGPRQGPLAGLGGDVRHAVRRLVRSPGYAAAVIAVLALGIGANAAIFSALEVVVLGPPPFPDAHRIVFPQITVRSEASPDTSFFYWSYPKFRELREATGEVMAPLAAYAERSMTWTDPGDAESMSAEVVAPGYFEVLGLVPAAGRFFTADEESPDTPPGVAVLSHAVWTQRFGRDAGVVGRTVTAGGRALRVVGVAPEGFHGLTGEARLWVPLGEVRALMGAWILEGRGAHWLYLVGRLRPGVGLERADRRVATVSEAIEAVEPLADPGETVSGTVLSFRRVWTNPTTRLSVWILAAAAGLVLAIAVANLAGLLLARGRREIRETAVRLALGAGRWRLVRARLAESLLLALVGGGAGLLVARWGIGTLRAAWPSRFLSGAESGVRSVDPSSLRLDLPVLLFGLALAVVAGLAFGVLPALRQSGVRLIPSLREGRGLGGSGAGRWGGGARSWLVAGQMALSVVLLVGAGLLLATLGRLHAQQRGFEADRLLVLRYSLAGRAAAESEAATEAFHSGFAERLRGLPGVASVSLATVAPLSGWAIRTGVREVAGRPPWPEGQEPEIGVHLVDDRYFGVLGTILVRGRAFTASEAASDARVAVLNRTAAETLLAGDDPRGARLRIGFSVDDETPWWTVVGVVEDVLQDEPAAGMMPEIYLPLGAEPFPSITVLARTTGPPGAVVPAAREALRAMDEDLPFFQVTTGRELRARGVAETRVLVGLLGLFAGLALVLAATGLYAVVSQAVAERRREIGLRMALGARAGSVTGLVVRQGAVPVAVGAALGLSVAALASGALVDVLFEVSAHDLRVFGGAAAVLAGVGLLATWAPARRATSVDPAEALRAD